MSANFGQVSDGFDANFGQVCGKQNGVNQPISDRSDRFGQVFTTTSPTRTHKGFGEKASEPVQMRPTCPEQVFDHDLANHEPLARLWQAAIDVRSGAFQAAWGKRSQEKAEAAFNAYHSRLIAALAKSGRVHDTIADSDGDDGA